MNMLLMVHGQAVLEKGVVEEVYIYLEDGTIKDIGSIHKIPSHFRHSEKIEIAKNLIVVPGFIDMHIHGAAGSDTMDATSEALEKIVSVLPAEGTTSFLATTITQKQANIEHALKNVANYCKHRNTQGHAEILGIHLEGPFINKNRKGAQPEEYIQNPDIELFKRWQNIAEGEIKLVTCAPELENGIEFIQFLNEKGIIVSIGHSNANFEEVEMAVQAGAKQVTHLFNGMKGIHHREPGTAGAALIFKELMVEVITDGIHVNPEVIKLALAAKGVDGMILITDAMRAKWLQNGIFDLGGQSVSVADGKAVLADGTLAGSILKMNDAFKNIIEFTKVSLFEAVQMASVNPAKQLNVFDRKGSIAAGKDADLTILTNDYQVALTICRGEIAYKRG